MKTRLLIILFSMMFFGNVDSVFAPPQQNHEAVFDYAEHVIIGKILSVEILSEPDKDPSVPNGFALYEIRVIEYLKNPLDTNIIKVPGAFVYEESPRGALSFPYEVDQLVFLYIQKDYPNRLAGYDLIIRSHESRVLDGPICGVDATYQEGLCVIDKTGISADPSNCEGHPCDSGFISPLKQIKSGIPIDQIQCRDNLQLILKTSNNSPTCVKEKTIPKLIERGWGEPAPMPEPELQSNTTSEVNFDSEKYYEEFGFGSPLVYLDTSKPVLNNDNCNRYAYWLTEHQKEKIDLYEDYPRYPPWGNQIFPLVDYCISNGDLVKIVADDKIQWEFQLENEK